MAGLMGGLAVRKTVTQGGWEMKASDLMILAWAGLAVYLLLQKLGGSNSATSSAGTHWTALQGNTGYPPEARTGGGVWV